MEGAVCILTGADGRFRLKVNVMRALSQGVLVSGRTVPARPAVPSGRAVKGESVAATVGLYSPTGRYGLSLTAIQSGHTARRPLLDGLSVSERSPYGTILVGSVGRHLLHTPNK